MNPLIKRFLLFAFVILLSLCIIAGRLAYIQLMGTEHFSKYDINLVKKSVQQRQQQFIMHTGRGEILDRKGEALTGHLTHVLVIYPLTKNVTIPNERIAELTQLLDISADHLLHFIETLEEPKLFYTDEGFIQLSAQQAEKINELDIPGLLSLPFEKRYQERYHAQHLLGYIGQNNDYIRKVYARELAQGVLTEHSVIGISGLEKTFQPFLQGLGPTSLSYYVNAKGEPIPGLAIKYMDQQNSFYPLKLKTTLDLHLQQFIEQEIEQAQLSEAAVVVLDIEKSEIRAMASYPEFMDQMTHLEAWENKALKRYPPGSVFKIVTAAAALENNLVKHDHMFECQGELEGTNLHCWRKGGHGRLSFTDGFAQSCNIVFGQLAIDLGTEQLYRYALKLGLLEHNGWQQERLYNINQFKQLDGEEVGQIFSPYRDQAFLDDANMLAQTGIGQLDVQISPLAAANMLATIARGGTKLQVKAVSDIYYQSGGLMHRFGTNKLSEPKISPYTAYQLQKLLASVVDNGTARSALSGQNASGKTGTAEVGLPITHNHLWFAGLYPREKPQYSIVVVSLNQSAHSDSNPAVQIFSEVIKWLENNV